MIRKKIAQEVKGKLIHLMIDGCTRGNRQFLGIKIRYNTTKDGAIKELVRTLAIEEQLTRKTASNVKSEVLKILPKYEINLNQILTFTSDNGAELLLAAKLLETHARQSAEDDAIILELGEPGGVNVGDVWPENIEIQDGSITIQSVRCGAHTLQLAINDAIKSTPDILSVIDIARDLSKYLRTPEQVRRLKCEDMRIPQLDVVTRWGSSYDMIVSLWDLKEYCDTMSEHETKNLSVEDWLALENIKTTLEPARKATRSLQRENMKPGEFYEEWLPMKMKTQKIDCPPSSCQYVPIFGKTRKGKDI